MSAAAVPDAEQAGRRVEEVLDRLAASGDQAACEAAEELVRVLMDFYGAGLARLVALQEPTALERLLGDEVVSGMLVLHDLHPEPTAARITRALESLPGRPVELVGFDPQTGVCLLYALSCFATEVGTVELETAAKEPTLLQISRRPSSLGAA